MAITSGTDWRKMREEGVEVTLPSGMVALLRPMSLEQLFRMGKVPDSLTNIVAQMVGSGTVNTPDMLKAAVDFIELKDLVCISSFISPRIVDDPKGDDEISILDITSGDGEFVLSWTQRPQKELERFRTEQSEPLELARSSD